MTNCQSCGMPMQNPMDFGGGKTPEEATVEVDKIMGNMPAWKIQPSPVVPSEPVTTPVPPEDQPQ